MIRPARPRMMSTPGVAMPAPRAVGALLNVHAERDPDRPALTFEGVTLTRRELADRVNRRARTLQKAGVVEGDFVAIALPNCPAFLELAFAVWALGATPAPLSHKLPAIELAGILDLLKPRLIVIEDGSRTGDTPRLSEAETYDASADPSPLPEIVSKHLKAIASGGSTGRPKVIVDMAPAMVDPDVLLLGMIPEDVLLNPGPLYHAAPFGMTCFAMGWGLHIVLMPRFDAEETLRLIDQYRVSWLFQVPTMMHRIWSLPDDVKAKHDVSSLDAVMHIAAACPPWLKQKWIEWVGPETVWEIYTGTEALGGTGIRGVEWLDHPGSVGKVLPGYEMKVLNEAGEACAPGEIGEIYFMPLRGQGTTYRYLGAEPRANGTFETLGDMGYVDEDGWLYLADRRVDMIVSGGANVYPAEVEAAIDSFPGVQCSVVVGLPDADFGQRVHAIVETADGALDQAGLNAFLAERIAPYKRPRSLEVTTERLRDDAGKVRRSALRAERMQAV
ncbi:AMP-binding protein [Brevundimonas sp.]|uniref:AMP-binding protein n=1 Tax=Brevundimonas sp. TaxID=1871086 RepID=UPI00286D36D5|nr:AMP-binding protein [Brevundimonas sp.]